MNLSLQKSWISTFQWNKSPQSPNLKMGVIYILNFDDLKRYQQIISENAIQNQVNDLKSQTRELVYFLSQRGPTWIYRTKTNAETSKGSFSAETSYTQARDSMGSLVSHFKAHGLEKVHFNMESQNEDVFRGTLIGLEMGAYSFRAAAGITKPFELKVFFNYSKELRLIKETIKASEIEAHSINLARHLVNLPPNEINPKSLANMIKKWKWSKQVHVTVLEGAALQKQKMNLLMAVGQGAAEGPRFVHIKYRPHKKNKLKPIAFIGKGITFDTGGLDIKPSSAMRLMKKDMGGAATVLALANWVSEINYSRSCDFYLCLAENSVDGKSFRPSDVIQARSGHWVEIDNTDAEGRLVLADGLDVASEQKESPEIIIDVATLTGAIKVALGSDIAGLFSNQNILAEQIHEAGQEVGDYNWRMPLVERYFSSLNSNFADFKNSADGFGGAITAGLFLQKFVRGIPWAHLDIYAWSDKAQGAFSHAGGNGQGVQCLIQFLKKVK